MKKAFFLAKTVLFLACYSLSESSSIAQNVISDFMNAAQMNVWYNVVGTIASVEPQFVNSQQQYLVAETYTTLTIQPATFIDSPGSGTIVYFDLEIIAAQWASVTEQVQTRESSVRWARCSNHHNLWRKLFFPAQYQTVTRQVLVAPAHVLEVEKTVTDKQINTPASFTEFGNPPVYNFIDNYLLVSPSTLTGNVSSYGTTTQTCRGRY